MRVLSFLLPAVVSATLLQERQLGGRGGKQGIAGMRGGSQTKVAGIDNMEPRIRAGATRHVVKFGPYTLRAAVSTILYSPISQRLSVLVSVLTLSSTEIWWS
jgi:hypothetical protein